MDINHAPLEARDGGSGDAFQVAREHHEPRVSDGSDDLRGIVRVGEHDRPDRGAPRARERHRVGAVRDHAVDPRHRRITQRVEQRLQIGPAPRYEHGHGQRSRSSHRVQGASETGFGPAATVSVNGPVARRSLLVTTMK